MPHQPFIKFNFYEKNFTRERSKFKNILNSLDANNIHYSTLRDFPPCVTNNRLAKRNDKVIILSDSTAVLTHNIYFGKEFISINKLFIDSPFISIKCRNCTYNKKNICRGLLNNGFFGIKEKIVKKLGSEKYAAVKSDYENGFFVFGSICLNSCRFCVDKFAPDSVVKKIPFLSKYEIAHFLHYLPRKIRWVGTSYHCASGEFFDHPEFYDLIEFLPHFMSSGSCV